jgi:hypothetical protein
MQWKISRLVPDKYLTELRYFRNRVMHALDEVESFKSMVTYDAQATKQYALAFIGNLLMDDNSHYYLSSPNPYSKGLSCITAQFFLGSRHHTKELKKIGSSIGLPTFNMTSRNAAQQQDFFMDSIRISKIILETIYAQINADFKLGITLQKIEGVMLVGDADLSDVELTIKIKYDALIQALGQSIGNLREYGVLSDFYKMPLIRQEFAVLNSVVPLAKEFRNLRTHTGRYQKGAFQAVLSYIFQQDHQLRFVIINELDQLREKYSENSRELVKKEHHLCCHVM